MSKPEITILIPSLSQSTDSFKELVSTLLLSLYEVRPHTGLLATYQLSRRLNMINLPTQLIGDELTRKIGYPPPTNGGKTVNNFFLKAKANYTKFQQPTTNRCWFELVWLQIRTRTQRTVWKTTSLLRAPRHPSRSDETPETHEKHTTLVFVSLISCICQLFRKYDWWLRRAFSLKY